MWWDALGEIGNFLVGMAAMSTVSVVGWNKKNVWAGNKGLLNV
ncbi:hypothetical protein [Mesobacterium pallidum]|nr:hypothetical protein [Mesobacterium pallidum]